jgi:hypothetical protein
VKSDTGRHPNATLKKIIDHPAGSYPLPSITIRFRVVTLKNNTLVLAKRRL